MTKRKKVCGLCCGRRKIRRTVGERLWLLGMAVKRAKEQLQIAKGQYTKFLHEHPTAKETPFKGCVKR